ncbi:hypothetical protein J2752_000461 [Halarchaeum rubridurum]|uniref:Uncharacterized protein n=1 Tax=Halarchaeum rubridurum TaxID=489911 RepID=A0A8T4GJ77_9EURY|nr:hypothetical protein [Halarchaeum rubridurum]MBP1953580.1 hypothetical protein [Halarchaeum rubridurum]
MTADDFLGDDQLAECPVCGAVGLPERIDEHDCESFLARRGQ